MTLTSAFLKDALRNAKLPQIRVAIPSLRCRSKSVRRAAKAPQRDDLEKLFREDFAHLSNARQRKRIAPNPGRLAQFAGQDMARAMPQVA